MSDLVAPKGREWLRLQPDAAWGQDEIKSGFDVDYDCPPSHIKQMAAQVTRDTIKQLEKRGWRFDDKRWKAKILISDMPALDEVSVYKGLSMAQHTQTLFKPKIHCVVVVPFLRPLQVVNLDAEREHSESLGIHDGYETLKDIPQEALVNGS